MIPDMIFKAHEHHVSTLELILEGMADIATPREITAERFERTLNFGMLGLQTEYAARMLAPRASHEDRIIEVLMVPITYPPSLHIDEQGRPGATFFYRREQDIVPYYSPRPVRLDAVDSMYGRILLSHMDERFTIERDFPPAYDKLLAKEILQEAGFLVPDHVMLEPDDIGGQIERFQQQYGHVVVKAAQGARGKEVMMVNGRIDEAAEFAAHLMEQDHDVYLEEGIIPLKWDIEGVPQDWNVRSMVVMDEKATYVDMYARHRPMDDGLPVNLCRGASSGELPHMLDPGQLEAIAEAVYDGVRPAIIGIDSITDERGDYVIELNWMAGGLHTMTKMRGPLNSIAERMLPAFGDFLAGNLDERSDYRPYPFSWEDYRHVARFLSKGKHHKALDGLCQHLVERGESSARVLLNQAVARMMLDKPWKHLVDEAVEMDRDANTYYQAGSLMITADEIDIGRTYLEQSLLLNEDYILAYTEMARSFAMERDWDNVREWLQKGFDKSPEDMTAAASVYAERRNPVDAVIGKIILENHATAASHFMYLAMANEELELHDASLDAIDRAISMEPDNHIYYAVKTGIYVSMHDYESALATVDDMETVGDHKLVDMLREAIPKAKTVLATKDWVVSVTY